MGDDKKQAKTVSNSETTSRNKDVETSRGFVGGVNNSLPKTNNVQKTVVWTLGFLVVLAGSWLVVMHVRSSSDVAFTVKDKTYSKALIRVLAKIQTTEHSDKQTPKQAAMDLFNYFKEEQAASELGIAPSQAAITQEAETLRPGLVPYLLSDSDKGAIEKTLGNKKFTQPKLPASPTDTPYVNLWLSLVAYHIALQDSFSSLSEGQYQGFYFAFDFSDKIIANDPDVTVPGQGDARLIAKDQAYAKDQAKLYHDQILAGKLSAAELLNRIKADSRLAIADNSLSFSARDSTQFDNTQGKLLTEQVFPRSAADFISKQSKVGLQPVQLAQVTTTSIDQQPPKYADGIYYFVELDSAKKIVSNAKQNLASKLKSVKATYYGL